VAGSYDDVIDPGTGENTVLGGNGKDKITTGIGKHVVLGDNGRATYDLVFGLSVLSKITTIDPTYGDDDLINMAGGTSIVIGGLGSDYINVDPSTRLPSGIADGDDIVLGDNGRAEFNTASGSSLLTYLSTSTATPAVDPNLGPPTLGSVDYIYTGTGSNTVLGGIGGDYLTGGAGRDVVIGDNGNATFTNGVLTNIQTSDATVAGSYNDVIDTGAGDNTVLGGNGADKINGGDGTDAVLGDNGFINYAGQTVVYETTDTFLTFGADDIIELYEGDAYAFGGVGSETIRARLGNVHLIFGDNGRITRDMDGTTLESLTGNLGASDLIEVDSLSGVNVLLGGYADDTIRAVRPDGSFADASGLVYQPTDKAQIFAFGDHGRVVLDTINRPLEIRSVETAFGGNDVIYTANANDVLVGGFGNDELKTFGGDNVLFGDTGEMFWEFHFPELGWRYPIGPILPVWTLTKITATSQLPLQAGIDLLSSGSGQDLLMTGPGDDQAYAGSGNDVLLSNQATVYLPLTAPLPVSGWGNQSLRSLLGDWLTDGRPLGDQASQWAIGNFVPLNAGGDSLSQSTNNNYLEGGLGDDLYFITPGGNDSLSDALGYDTVSFQLSPVAVTIDLDYLDRPQYLTQPGWVLGQPPVASLTYRSVAQNSSVSPFENFIGSPYADVVLVSPLKVTRTLRGGLNVDPSTRPYGDELRIRTNGNTVRDDGLLIGVSGLGDVNHYDFETYEWLDGVPIILDDGGREWHQSGGFQRIVGPTMQEGDAYAATAATSNSSNVAGWDVSRLSPGPYQLSLTWPEPNASFTYRPNVVVRDSAGQVKAETRFDQRTNVPQVNSFGNRWFDYGPTIDVGMDRFVQVDFTSRLFEYFVADALRIDRVRKNSSEIRILDLATGQEVLSGLLTSDFGDVYASENKKAFRIFNIGSQPLNIHLVQRNSTEVIPQFRFVDGTVLDAAQRNSFSSGFSLWSGMDSGGKSLTVPPGQSRDLVIAVDTSSTGPQSGSLLLETNDVNESVFSIGLKATVVMQPKIFDNLSKTSDAMRFSVSSGTVTNTTDGLARDGSQHVGLATKTNRVVWAQAALPAERFTGRYRISATWNPNSKADNKATFTVKWGSQTRTVVLNQQLSPALLAGGFTKDGSAWVDLVPDADITAADTLRIELAGNGILADAIRIQKVANTSVTNVSQLELTDQATGRIISGQNGVWDFGALQLNQSTQRTLVLRNAGSVDLTIPSSPSMGIGFSFVGQLFPSLTLKAGQSTSLAVRFDASTFGDIQTPLRFVSNDPANRNVSLTLRAKVIEEFFLATDDSTNFRSVGFTSPVGSIAPIGSSYSKLITVGYRDGDSGIWSFKDLEPGIYSVYATWDSNLITSGATVKPPLSDRVPYVMQGGVSDPVTTVDVNQRQSANDEYSQNKGWKFLSNYVLTGRNLEVAIQSVTARTTVHADAIRLVRNYYSEPLVAVQGKTVDKSTVVDFGMIDQGGSYTVSVEIKNPMLTPLLLRKIVELPSGYTTSFVPQYLQPGAAYSFLITLSGEDYGWRGGRFAIETSDFMASIFSFGIAGQVRSKAIFIDDTDPGLTFSISNPFTRTSQLNYMGSARAIASPLDSATWTVTGLSPGAYRVSTTWGVQSVNVEASQFDVTTLQSNAGPVVYNQTQAPSSDAKAFWDNNHWWVDLSSEIQVGSDGTLVVSALHLGPRFRELIVDAIRVEKLTPKVFGAPRIATVNLVDESSIASDRYVRGDLRDRHQLDFGSVNSEAGSGASGANSNPILLNANKKSVYSYSQMFGWLGTPPRSIELIDSSGSLADPTIDSVWDTEIREYRVDLPAGAFRFEITYGGSWIYNATTNKIVPSTTANPIKTKFIDYDNLSAGPVVLRFFPDTTDRYWSISSMKIARRSAPVVQTPPALSYKWDFNAANHLTQPGYTPVAERTYYTQQTGYGWQIPNDLISLTPSSTAPKESDWGDRSLPSGVDATTVQGGNFQSLLRDGQKHLKPRNFRVDLPDGDYSVTVTVGGPEIVPDVDIYVVNEAKQGVQNISTGVREFKRVNFVATASNGILILRFESSNPATEWVVNAIEIQNYTKPTEKSFPEQYNLEAGLASPYIVRLDSIQPGLYTLISTLGTVTGSDSDNLLAYPQISTSSTGSLTFQLSSNVSGSGVVSLQSLTGTQYTVPITFKKPFRRFDLNDSTTQVNQDGYTSVLPSTVYSSDLGYGWGNAVGSLDRGTAGTTSQPTKLFQDKHTSSAEAYFMISAEVGKSYDIRLLLGDTVARDVEVSVNGAPYQRFNTAASEYLSTVIRTTALDSRIEIQVRGLSVNEWALSGIDVLEVAGTQVTKQIETARVLVGFDSLIARTVTTAGEAIAPGNYWVSVNGGSVRNSAGQRMTQVVIGTNSVLQIYLNSNLMGSGKVELVSENGELRYLMDVIYQLPPVRRFDLNDPKTPVTQDGYTSVLPSTVYSNDRGHGWDKSVSSVDRGTASTIGQPAKLFQDKHTSSAEASFSISAEVGKIYDIRLLLGDTVARDIEVSINGAAYQRFSTAASEYLAPVMRTTAVENRIRIQIRGSSIKEWALSGIDVLEVTGTQVTKQLETARGIIGTDTLITRTVTTAGESIASGIYWISTNAGSVRNSSSQRLTQLAVGSNSNLQININNTLPVSGKVELVSENGELRYLMDVIYQLPPVRRYDFNHSKSPVTQDGYTGVLPSTVYSNELGFGWDKSVGSVDRGVAGTIAQPAKLYQDKHTGSAEASFMVSAEVGKSYDLRLLLGDTVARSVEVSVNGSAYQRFNTALSEYLSAVIRTTALENRIRIQIRGSSIKEWALSGIDVLEVTGAQVTKQLETASGLVGIETLITRSVTTNGEVIVPGNYWVSANVGSVRNSAGQRLTQVTVGSNSNLQIYINSTQPVSGKLELVSEKGDLRYQMDLVYQLRPIRLYDFNNVVRKTTSPTAINYTSVLPTDLYSQTRGYGWDAATKSVDRGTTAKNLPQPAELNRDKHFEATDRVFYMMSEPGKSYDITVYFGDTEVRNVGVSVDQGTTYQSVSTAANQYTSRTWSVTATSDRLQVRVRRLSGSNWSINGIDVREVTQTVSSSGRAKAVIVWPQEVFVNLTETHFEPVAIRDLAATRPGQSIGIAAMSNDFAQGGELNSNSIEIVSEPTTGTAVVIPDGQILFTPGEQSMGVVKFSYRVRDSHGIVSNYADVLVNVSDRLQTNFMNPMDSNGDEVINPLDVLAVIDYINTGLSSTANKSYNNTNRWVDTNGDGFVNPLDALRVIDYLNAMNSSNAQSEGVAEVQERPMEDAWTLPSSGLAIAPAISAPAISAPAISAPAISAPAISGSFQIGTITAAPMIRRGVSPWDSSAEDPWL
jgi:hypothetical protein